MTATMTAPYAPTVSMGTAKVLCQLYEESSDPMRRHIGRTLRWLIDHLEAHAEAQRQELACEKAPLSLVVNLGRSIKPLLAAMEMQHDRLSAVEDAIDAANVVLTRHNDRLAGTEAAFEQWKTEFAAERARRARLGRTVGQLHNRVQQVESAVNRAAVVPDDEHGFWAWVRGMAT